MFFILKKLYIGDTIGIISPAGCEKNNLTDYNLKQIKDLGFKIKESSNLRKINKYLAGTDKERANDFMEMYKNPSIKAILCYRGGYGSIRMMRYVDWNIVKNNSKIFCGFSDITLLLNYINKVSNSPTFHTPMANSNFKDKLTKEYFLSLLTANNNIDLNQFNSIKVFNKKNISASLCGGNLSMICSAIGTPYDIDTTDKILILEDVNEPIYKIDRMLTQLLVCGKLHKCSGFILGYFTPYNDDILTLIKEILIPLNKPIVAGFPIGHDYPNISLPIGSTITLDFTKNIIYIANIFK
ncbi:MAG: LD-carboxypeptidase [Clostridium perfringens]|nr:LD-carboxypeptidase [Clostridium perfringens]